MQISQGCWALADIEPARRRFSEPHRELNIWSGDSFLFHFILACSRKRLQDDEETGRKLCFEQTEFGSDVERPGVRKAPQGAGLDLMSYIKGVTDTQNYTHANKSTWISLISRFACFCSCLSSLFPTFCTKNKKIPTEKETQRRFSVSLDVNVKVISHPSRDENKKDCPWSILVLWRKTKWYKNSWVQHSVPPVITEIRVCWLPLHRSTETITCTVWNAACIQGLCSNCEPSLWPLGIPAVAEANQ